MAWAQAPRGRNKGAVGRRRGVVRLAAAGLGLLAGGWALSGGGGGGGGPVKWRWKGPAPAPRSESCGQAACRDLARRGRPLVFWHISKCGGTSICLQALANGEKVRTDTDHPDFRSGKCVEGFGPFERENNAPGWCHDGCHPPARHVKDLSWGTPGEQERALEQVFGPAEGGLSFVGPEKQVPPSGFRPGAVDVYSFIALREPKARMVSQYGQKLKGRDIGQAAGGAPAVARHPGAFPDKEGPGFLQKVADAKGLDRTPTLAEYLEHLRDHHNDNMMIRYLLGLFHSKLEGLDRRITAADLEAAKAVLRDQMEFVLITERLGEAGCLLEQLGWEPEPPHARQLAVPSAPGADPLERTEAAEALLDELNTFDPELYAYAVELFEAHLARCACCEAEAGRAARG